MRKSEFASLPDAVLWKQALSGDKAAFSYLYETFAPVLYNYSYRFTGDQAFTEDCIQELFLRLLERGSNLSETDSIKFYLFRALRRDIVRRLDARDQQTLPLLERDTDFRVEFTHEPSWLEHRISEERSAHLLSLLNRLPARQKEVVYLRFYDELPYDEIAQIMGISQLSTYKVLYKALASLGKHLPARAALSLLLLLLTKS